MDTYLVQTKNLHYAYSGDMHALRGVSVNIKKGEKIAVLGANGAGKSTFFLNLNGVLIPEEGEIIYKGKPIGHKKKDLQLLRKNVGIVFQDADNQIIAPSVLGEISFGPMNLKLSKEEVKERVYEAMEVMNLTDYKDRAPHYLSGGEKKRVTIADILAMKPELIIFDEPTASLDPVNAEVLEKALHTFEEQEVTMLLSTHDVDFAYRWADRILVFNAGKIVADGMPVDIFKDEQLLAKANLKKPVLLSMYELLTERGKISAKDVYPKTVEEFEKII